MTTRKLFTLACLAAFAMTWLLPGKLSAQTPADLPAEYSPDKNSQDPVDLVISYGDGTETHLPSHRGMVEPVSLRPDQLRPFFLQFPREKVGMPVAFAPLDGGEVIPMASVTDLAVSANGTFTFNYEQAEELSVDGDGIVRFGFQSSHEPGRYRVMVQLPGEQHILQFYVINPGTPAQPSWHH